MMQLGVVPAFLSLWLGHLAGDFLFQSDRILEQKRQARWPGYLKHGAAHYCVALASLLLLSGVSAWGSRAQLVLCGLVAVHLLSDYGKVVLVRRGRIRDGTGTFAADQVWHTATVGMAALLISRAGWEDLRAALLWFQAARGALLPVLVVYTAVIFGGGHLIRYVTKPLLEGLQQNLVETPSADRLGQLRNAGMYIGWLERFLVLTALILQSPATVGLILTAKSIVRFPELKDLRFAEYFLIGTLLSLSLALVGGMILVKTTYGHLSLK